MRYQKTLTTLSIAYTVIIVIIFNLKRQVFLMFVCDLTWVSLIKGFQELFARYLLDRTYSRFQVHEVHSSDV
jgi:predicted neutral ceramidase superfamily lipid hydrolase